MEEKLRDPGRPLSQEQQLQITEFQHLEADFIALCKKIGLSRDLSLAITYMEDAAMRAVRHVLGAP